MRRRHGWLHRATTTQLELTNTTFVYEVRGPGGRLVIALNLGDQPLELPRPAPTPCSLAKHPFPASWR